jgi:hypothetical protein
MTFIHKSLFGRISLNAIDHWSEIMNNSIEVRQMTGSDVDLVYRVFREHDYTRWQGLKYQQQPVTLGAMVCVDDDLNLYFTKVKP